MELIIKINCNGAALDEILECYGPSASGMHNVLQEVSMLSSGNVMDTNGNTVGSWEFVQ